MKPRPLALVTGGSRGVGACVVEGLAEQGFDVALNYHSKRSRAELIAQTCQDKVGDVFPLQADICQGNDVDSLLAQTAAIQENLNVLVLNASGGLEKNKPANYPMQLNHDAQCDIVDKALPLMRPGARIIYVTSHLAHFYGEQPVYPSYEVVAKSKHAGEQALLSRQDIFKRLGIHFSIVSGDLIDGTITPKLMQRGDKNLIAKRLEQVGYLPTIEDFAEAIVTSAIKPLETLEDVIFVGSIEPLEDE